MAGSETVLCVPEAVLPWMGIEHGYYPAFDREMREMLDVGGCCWLAKERAEQLPAFKQVIPYCLVMHDDEEGGKLLGYTRGGPGEARLAGKLSLGIGGHISKERDTATMDHALRACVAYGAAIRRGMWAEFNEELSVRGIAPPRAQFQGFVYDEQTEVGRVHLGLVYVIALPSHSLVGPSDPAVTELEWRHPQDYLEDRDRFEGWSRILLDAYRDSMLLH